MIYVQLQNNRDARMLKDKALHINLCSPWSSIAQDNFFLKAIINDYIPARNRILNFQNHFWKWKIMGKE